jgi:hypothetical protein
VPEERVELLKEKIAKVRAQMKVLAAIDEQLAASPDQQVSLTDPDARSMATSGRGTGLVATTYRRRSMRRTTSSSRTG